MLLEVNLLFEGTSLESRNYTHGDFSSYRVRPTAIDVKQMLWFLQGEQMLKKPRVQRRTWSPHPPHLVELFTCVSFSCPSPEQNRLSECEEQAKAAKKGMWSEGNGSHTIRDLKYTIENPRHFVDSRHQKPVNGEAGGERHNTEWFLFVFKFLEVYKSYFTQ